MLSESSLHCDINIPLLLFLTSFLEYFQCLLIISAQTTIAPLFCVFFNREHPQQWFAFFLFFFFFNLCDLHWSLVSAVGTVLIVAVNVAFLHLEFNYGDIDALSQHFVVLFSVPHKPLCMKSK